MDVWSDGDATITLNLPDELIATVREQANKYGCRDEIAYLAEIVSDGVLQQLRTEIDTKLLEGIRDLEEGRSEQVTPEFWRKLRTRIHDQKGSVPNIRNA